MLRLAANVCEALSSVHFALILTYSVRSEEAKSISVLCCCREYTTFLHLR